MKFFIILLISLLLFSCGENNDVKSTDFDYEKDTDHDIDTETDTDNIPIENDIYESPETDDNSEVEDNFDESFDYDFEPDNENHDVENDNVPDQDQICVPNTTSCYTDYVVLVCDENGYAKEWIPCGANEICDHRDYNECRTIICEANTDFCENNSVYRCDSFGVEKDLIEECQADQDCVETGDGTECQ